jgi:hypothetical protein
MVNQAMDEHEQQVANLTEEQAASLNQLLEALLQA